MPSPSTSARNPVVRPPWRFAALGGVLGLMAALLLFAPASWLASALSSATSGQLQLLDARGTVWNGSARLAFSGGAGSRDRTVLPGQLDWKLRPGWMGLKATVSAECCTPQPLQVSFAQRWGGPRLEVVNGSSQWPATLLAGLGTPWNTVQAEGILQLATQGLSVEWFEGRMSLAGRAELTAIALSSRLSTLKPMGSYRLTLTGGANPTLDLATLEGSLQLSGSGQWIGSRLRFRGAASAAPENESSLANLLNIIGRRNGSRSIITLG